MMASAVSNTAGGEPVTEHIFHQVSRATSRGFRSSGPNRPGHTSIGLHRGVVETIHLGLPSAGRYHPSPVCRNGRYCISTARLWHRSLAPYCKVDIWARCGAEDDHLRCDAMDGIIQFAKMDPLDSELLGDDRLRRRDARAPGRPWASPTGAGPRARPPHVPLPSGSSMTAAMDDDRRRP